MAREGLNQKNPADSSNSHLSTAQGARLFQTACMKQQAGDISSAVQLYQEAISPKPNSIGELICNNGKVDICLWMLLVASWELFRFRLGSAQLMRDLKSPPGVLRKDAGHVTKSARAT